MYYAVVPLDPLMQSVAYMHVCNKHMWQYIIYCYSVLLVSLMILGETKWNAQMVRANSKCASSVKSL